MSCIIYIVQANRGEPASLAVMDRGQEQFHMFPLSVESAARLAMECTAFIHSQLTGFDDKRAAREIGQELSRLQAGE